MRKITMQSIVCLFLAGIFFAAAESPYRPVSEAAAYIDAKLSKEYTLQEIAGLPARAAEAMKALPVSFEKVKETFGDGASSYGEPIDKKPMTETAMVYAVAGGTVRETGENEDIGKYVVISHGTAAESVYGNLSNVRVTEKERVKKGEIVGGYEVSSEKEFYYSLNSSE